VTEAIVKRYKSALADEIEPVIAELIERAQQGLSALEKKEHSLQTKVNMYTHLLIFILLPYF
jgi:DASH complex subunit SPC19